jgi:three-Cys-motif partner protein
VGQIEWNEACKRVQVDDGLPFRRVGGWSEDKLFVWHKYIQTTSTAMVGSPKWRSGLCYVDLFAGPGVCCITDSGKRLPGSPLIATMAPKDFSRILLAELDPGKASACEKRLHASGSKNFTMFQGDSNNEIARIVKEIPKGALTVAFIDPEGLDVHFDTVRQLSSAGRVDLLILFADAYDVLRNLSQLIDGQDARLDRMFAPKSNWRDEVRHLPNWKGNTLREYFASKYAAELRQHLGYVASDTKIIAGPRGPMYRLVYLSKHERGLDFWKKVDAKDRFGQSSLFSP